MDKEKMIQSILKTVEVEIRDWMSIEDKITDPIYYESNLLQRSFKIGRMIMEGGNGKLPRDRNAKKKS